MSQIYMIGDTHFGKSAALNLKKWMGIQFDYFYNQLIPYLVENVKKGDILIHGGDLFDDRTHTPIIILNKVDQLLIDLSKILPVHIIIGNHDMYNKIDTSINTPKLFRWIPNIHIYENTTIINIDNINLVLMPWVEHRHNMIEELKNNPGDYLFCHSDLNGCRMHLSSIAYRNSDKIEVEEFSGYKRVFSSHIHIRQIQENFEFIGAPYQMDRNDYDDIKGLTILDLETEKTKFIENITSPTFKKFKIEKDGDLLLLEHLNTKKHFIDLEINQSVLIGKRKNRRLLEEQLGKKKFASVDYINDLVKKDQSELPQEVELGDLKFDDFDDVIVRYTKSQEYENGVIKNGVMSELNNILTIYKKEYKFKSDE